MLRTIRIVNPISHSADFERTRPNLPRPKMIYLNNIFSFPTRTSLTALVAGSARFSRELESRSTCQTVLESRFRAILGRVSPKHKLHVLRTRQRDSNQRAQKKKNKIARRKTCGVNTGNAGAALSAARDVTRILIRPLTVRLISVVAPPETVVALLRDINWEPDSCARHLLFVSAGRITVLTSENHQLVGICAWFNFIWLQFWLRTTPIDHSNRLPCRPFLTLRNAWNEHSS